MPLTLRCPQCGKELVAPDELLGKVAACPQCNLTFPVTGSVRTTNPQATPPPPPSVSDSHAVLKTGTAASGSTTASTTIPTNLPPLSASVAAPPPSKTNGPKRAKSEPKTRDSASDIKPVELPDGGARDPRSANNTAATSSTGPRRANAARFIAANPTERRIDLGADGRLPELVLDEGARTEQAAPSAQANNPLVLVVVLSISFGLSALLLLVDPTSRRSESERIGVARDELVLHYTQSHRRLEPYQELLRQALQFHNQAKYAEERRCYRRVLDLLHEEHRDNLKGLTGVRRGASPPSDEHLESLLSQLLSND